MTRQCRFLFALLLPLCIGMVLACGGAGTRQKRAGTPTTEETPSGKQPTAPGSDADQAIIKDATKKRDEAIAKAKQIQAKNDDLKRQYEENLEAFEKAKAQYEEHLTSFKNASTEYKSLKNLDFAKNLKTKDGQTKWYNDIVREFPGTDASKEAQRRLAGGVPKSLPVPLVPVEPKLETVAPNKPRYEAVPLIPKVPTLAQLHERRFTNIAYEVVKNVKRKLDGKLIMSILVDERATREEVLKLAESLRREHAGKYATISIFDSREACRAVIALDMTYPETQLDLHWLVVVDWGGDTRSKEEIRWVAKGRDH